jgi:hypothetical protein
MKLFPQLWDNFKHEIKPGVANRMLKGISAAQFPIESR